MVLTIQPRCPPPHSHVNKVSIKAVSKYRRGCRYIEDLGNVKKLKVLKHKFDNDKYHIELKILNF